MPAKWKKSPRFDPAIILSRIDKGRTVSPGGGAAFHGFEWEECLPALSSMLSLPPAASEIDSSTLIWRALTKVPGPLTPVDFLAAVNRELSSRLATREVSYRLLTTISLHPADIPRTISSGDTTLRFLAGNFPRSYVGPRDELIRTRPVPTPATPSRYCKVIVSVRSKSPTSAVHKALRALDLQRALWSSMVNPTMSISFGGPSLNPINVVRLGSQHTLHLPDGIPATEAIWFDPGFLETSVYRISKPALMRKYCVWAMQRIRSSSYQGQLVSALVRFVRALDEQDATTSFLRLWSALESLTTPGIADYERLVRRCVFLFKDASYHRQILEHLREYRNETVHAGEYSDHARTLCYQTSLYFVSLIRFHIRNASFFTSLDEANAFLDSPADKDKLIRQMKLGRKALKFIG